MDRSPKSLYSVLSEQNKKKTICQTLAGVEHYDASQSFKIAFTKY